MARFATLILLCLFPAVAFAEDFKGYRTTTIDAVLEAWDGQTRGEGPGFSFSRPEKIKLVATMSETPRPCDPGNLSTVLKMMNFADLLKQIKVTHCFGITAANGRSVFSLRSGFTGAGNENRRQDRSTHRDLCGFSGLSGEC
jgi:hypothetical protein